MNNKKLIMSPTSKRKNAPPTTSLKSPNTQKSKKLVTNKGRIQEKKLAPQITLEGIECHKHVYLAWLKYSTGLRKNQGYYTKPLDDAWRATVMDNNGGEPSPLYLEPPHQSNKSIIELFQVDYWTERRAVRAVEQELMSTDGGNFAFKTFVWVRPTIEDDDERGHWQLNDWLSHLKEQLNVFVKWTKKNPDSYDFFKYPFNLTISERDGITPLADEILDKSLIVVIRDMFDSNNVQDILNDTVAEDSIRNLFFGSDVSIQSYQNRIQDAWNDVMM